MEKECEREDMSAKVSERMKSLKKMREKLIFDASLWNMTPTPLGHAKPYSFKNIEDMTFKFQLCKLINVTKYGRMFIVYDETPTQYLSRVISEEESFRWEDRMKVATQLASLFTWLHEKRFAIGRMEPSAIMIDKEFNIKMVDFSSLVHVRDIPHNILPDAPEADNVTETLKDDVYAFGILLLRLITNNKNIEGPYHWWILEELQGGKRSIVDKSVLLNCDGVLTCGITKLAAECLDEDPNARPDMKNVFDRLTNLNHGRAKLIITKTDPRRRQGCDVFSERPGEQFRQIRMMNVLTLALVVGCLRFLFKKQ
ncbi:hypothetical protein KY289_008488 [Solanum tuberosum]|nr:hypothetical protein KY289_008488 [Solanum tuberosum]